MSAVRAFAVAWGAADMVFAARIGGIAAVFLSESLIGGSKCYIIEP